MHLCENARLNIEFHMLSANKLIFKTFQLILFNLKSVWM